MEARQYLVLTNSASKRSLFPKEKSGKLSSDDESLGHMSPLRSSSPDRYSSPTHSPCMAEETPVKQNSHAIQELVFGTPKQDGMTLITDLSEDIVAETPDKGGRFDEILTPFKSLVKRIFVEETPDSVKSGTSNINILKKKMQGMRSPTSDSRIERKPLFNFNSQIASLIQNSFYKPQHCRAKTALFPEKTVGEKRPRTSSADPKVKVRLNSTFPSYNHNRNHKRRRVVLGEINCGVYHKVRKPKPKKLSSSESVKRSLEEPKVQLSGNEEAHLNNGVKGNNNQTYAAPLKKLKMSEHKVLEEIQSEPRQPPSPEPEPVPDPSKKFFKTNRTMAITHKATVTVADNVRISVHKGKLALDSPARKVKPQRKELNTIEDIIKDFDEETSTNLTDSVQDTVEEVLKKLEDEEREAFDSSEHIQSITSSTSSLALDDKELEKEHFAGNMESKEDKGNPKYFPVFYKDKAIADAPADSPKQGHSSAKKWKPMGDDQYQIDAGQVWLRPIQCKECGVLYQKGDPDDEISHLNIHNKVRPLRFMGWKNERVIMFYPEGKVIVIYPNDPKTWLKKAKEILDVVDEELGFVEGHSQSLEHSKIYLYIMKNRVVGVLVAQPKNEAYRMLSLGVDGPDCCSEETYPVKCGVTRLWTVFDQRRKGIATKLMDGLRVSFMFDQFLTISDIAFSVPTDNGKAFAEKYFKTPQFMVFY